jgi:hypothetical protein
MKTITISIGLYEKGDYVCTPDGVGIVNHTTITKDKNNYFICQNVFVQHKNATSRNPSNKIKEIEHIACHLITEEEYRNEI